MSDVRAFLNSFKTKSLSKSGKTAAAVEEISPLKRRRFQVASVMKKKIEAVDEIEVAKMNVETLIEFFNERLVCKLAIL